MPHLNCPRCDLTIYKWGLPAARFHCPRCLIQDGLRVDLRPATAHIRMVDVRRSTPSESMGGRTAPVDETSGPPAA
ncbi:MAG: hypothetical protein E6G00_12555 [Actinobacteria bacterium]|nr:MAG: hypothetical protein E6G29_08275 [Actinomycetota bacterium]TMM08381.1 MAG: hypothetical protein E6G00_12555 [Actinomycetota bacterium]